MSVLQFSSSKMEHLSDWMNPILVKETRQALKSRSFVATFMLLLVASWLICIFGVMVLGINLQFGSPSRDFFQAFFVVLSAAVLVVIPYSAYRSLLTEQDAETYELLSITTLTPRQIVLGKLSNSVVQVFVFYSAIAPFIAFTSLLQGFDLLATSALMSILFFVAVLLCTLTLMLSTVSQNKQIQTISSLFVMGGLGSSFGIMWAFSAAMTSGEVTIDREFWVGLGCMFLIGVSYFFLFLQITISRLMYESGNKSTGVRIIATGQFLLFWLLLVGGSSLFSSTIDDEAFAFVGIASLIHWGAFGYFIAMERDHLSRRIRRDLSANGLRRMLIAPFMPGGTRGYGLLLVNLALLLLVIELLKPMSPRIDAEFSSAMIAATCYLVIYLGIGCTLSRWLLKQSNQLKPMHARTLLIVIFAVGAVLPAALLALGGYYRQSNRGYHLIQISDPFTTISEISSGTYASQNALMLLVLGAALVIAINTPALVRGFGEILVPERPQDEAEPNTSMP